MFAPVAAIVTLGFTFGKRRRPGVEIAIGVAVGVAVGDRFLTVFGTGAWQIAVVGVIAMSLATVLGAGQLMITQAGVQAIIVITLLPQPTQGVNRWLDALIGCVLALLVATVAPSAPLRKPRIIAAQVLDEMVATLSAAEQALRDGDPGAGEAVLQKARASDSTLNDLDDAASEGLEVVRYSPFLRGKRPAVQAYSELHDPLRLAAGNLRVLARRCAVVQWREETVPLAYLVLMGRLAEIVRFMAGELYDRRLPEAARDRLVELAGSSAQVALSDSLSAVVILAQTRSMIVDLLQLTGLDVSDAQELIPEMAG